MVLNTEREWVWGEDPVLPFGGYTAPPVCPLSQRYNSIKAQVCQSDKVTVVWVSSLSFAAHSQQPEHEG